MWKGMVEMGWLEFLIRNTYHFQYITIFKKNVKSTLNLFREI